VIVIKSSSELAVMREAGRIVAETLDALRERIKPGVTTEELDAFAEEFITRHHATPAFKGYRGFPASICTSVDEQVVHGIPSKRVVLKEGEIISVDVGAILQGFVGDGAATFPVGTVSENAQRLMETTQGALMAGIAQARANNHLEDISGAVQDYVEQRGFSVVREYVGHGIGRAMHEEPQIPNYRQGKQGPLLRPGMTLAIEPMVNEGTWQTKTLRDKWTVITQDRKLSAHFEHTVAITDNGPEILTRL
jgi:methionyl aminopeptidase